MFKASDLEMELRSLFHLNHSVVLLYSVFSRSIVSDLPFRGIKVNLVVSASFLDSNRYGSAPFTLILDFPLIISISVKQCTAVRAIHRYRCPIIFCHAHHLIKFLDAFGVTVAAQKC